MVSEANKVKLSAVGDIMLGDLPACFGFGVGSKIKQYGPHFPFSMIMDTLTDNDILLGNLESVLSNRQMNKWWLPTLYMRGDPRAVNTLINCGFKVLSVSNNHMMQHGAEAFRDTVNILKSNGICPIGLKSGSQFNSKPYITEIKGIRLGFLGYSLRPEEYRPTEVLYCHANENTIIEDIHRIREDVDFVIISLHWGDEYVQRPSPNQIAMARRLINEGADIILGHHPHVLQGIENYEGGLIAYSLGNFIFDMWMSETRKSIVLEILISEKGIDDFRIIPLMISERYQPYILNGKEKCYFHSHFDNLCRYLRDSNCSDKDYHKDLLECFNRYRKSVIQHYKKNIFRYSFFYLLQLLIILFIRRFLKKHI